MKIPFPLGKPRWQSKDADLRREAVASDEDAELVASLPRIVREDPDPRVRGAALLRLADPGVAQRALSDDADASVRAVAKTLWLDLLAGTHAAAPPLAERLRLLRAQDDATTIEHLACSAREPELRAAALERVSRMALLGERALADPDPGLRAALVERIDDTDLLARIAERARKSDKAVSRGARERIESLRIQRGDAEAIASRARALCERAEDLLRKGATPEDDAALLAQWSSVARHAPPDNLRLRFERACALLQQSRVPRPTPVEASPPDAIDEAMAHAAPTPVEALPDADSTDVAAPLIAQARFAASIDEAQNARRAEEARRREREGACMRELERAAKACADALEAGESALAHAAKVRMDAARQQAPTRLPATLTRLLADVDARHAELARWQYWADNAQRRRIVEEMEALPQAGLHPDAVAAKVREAQAEWTRLDRSEGPRPRAGDLARRFHAACRAALAPAQAYFRKRQELRRGAAEEVAAVVDRALALAADAPVRELAAARNALRDILRSLDRVEPRERNALARRIKDALAALDARIAEHDAAVEQAKAALIAEATALADGMPRGAAAAARTLQQRWKDAGNGRRSRDQKQWNEFRGAVDRVFGNLDAQRVERGAQEAAVRERAAATCAEFEQLAASDAADRGEIARVRKAWNELRVQDPALMQRFEAAQQRLQERSRDAERRARRRRFDEWHARYRLCRAAENREQDGDAIRAAWSAPAAGDIAAAALSRRLDDALDAPDRLPPCDAQVALDVLLPLELVAAIEPSSEDRERRRELQVARLAARLRGEDAATPAEELAALLQRWTELGAVSGELEHRFERALAGAVAQLP